MPTPSPTQDLPISQLPELTAITANSEFAVAQGGTTYRVKKGNMSSGNIFISAYHSTTQSGYTANTAYTISASTVAHSNGITVVNGGEFHISSGGTYNIQFSLQLDKKGGTSEDIDIWLAKNGTNVDWTNTNITLANNNNLVVAAWNFVEPLATGDYVELKVNVSNTNVIIFAEDPQFSPTRPGTPSAIITITQI